MKNKTNPPKPWKPTQIGKPTNGISSVHGNVMGSRKDHALFIGLIVTQWSRIERSVIDIFSYINDERGWEAAKELDKRDNFQPKIARFLQEISAKWGKESEAIARQILRRTSDLRDIRDDLAHASFHTRSDYPDGIIKTTGWGKEEKYFLYTLRNLEAIITEGDAVEAEIQNLWCQIVGNYKPEKLEKGRYMIANFAN